MQTKPNPGSSSLTTAAYYLGSICLGAATAILGPTLQGLAKNTGTTLAQISSLFLLTSFGYLIGSYAAGKSFDKAKGHPLIGLALLAMAITMGAIPAITVLLVLQCVFFILGIAESYLDLGTNTLLVWLHGDRVPPFMSGLHAFYGIGTTTAPLIVAAVLSSMGSLNSVYWLLALLMIPVGLFTIILPSPSHILARQQAEERPALPILVFLLAVIFFAFTGAELGFGGWIYTFTTSQSYGTPLMAARINAAFWAAITIGRLISIPLAMKFKPQQILWVDFCGAIASLLFIIFFSSNETLLWVGTIATGLFMASVFPTLLNDAQSRMHMSGKTTSRFFIGASLGSMVIPWLMGQVITPLGATAVMVVALVGLLFSTGTFIILNLLNPASAKAPTR